MKIELHIGRIILDGVDAPPGSGTILREAVEHELQRLIAEHGLAPGVVGSGALARTDGAMELCAGEGPSALGARIARAVHAGMQP